VVVELKDGLEGKLGEEVWFSDLYAAAVRDRFTGRIFLDLGEGGEAHAFFQEGNPIHTSGTAIMHSYLGELLVQKLTIGADQLEKACNEQQSAPGRPLGQILGELFDVPREEVEAAVRLQIGRRTATLFAATQGSWRVKENDLTEVDQIGVAVDGFPLLLFSLRHHASDEEARALSDALLGKAVQNRATPAQIEQLALADSEKKVLALLGKPRKVHQLEMVATDRRGVRVLLKALLTLGYLELLPAKQGLPIKEALKIQLPNPVQSTPPPEKVAPTPAPVRAAPKKPTVDPEIVKELKALQAKLDKLTHFEVLGVKEDVSAADVRIKYTQLAKKYHPDALGPDVDTELEVAERAVSAALNEAYTILTDAEARAKYLEQMKQGVGSSDHAAARASSGRVKFEMGMVYLRKHEFKTARETFSIAIDLAPQNGLYKAAKAYAMLIDPTYDRSEALKKGFELILEGTKLSPKEAPVHFYAGRFYKERNEPGLAQKAFQRALEIDPKYVEAERELRLLDLRKKKENDDEKEKGEKGGRLSKLFKR
jgi:curved DNA-binding protein CbpA